MPTNRKRDQRRNPTRERIVDTLPGRPHVIDPDTGVISEPSREDDKATRDREARGRAGKRIRVPAKPPAATRASVEAEIRASKAAERMIARARWRQARTAGADELGVLEQDDVPEAETERALQPRPPKQTPRGLPTFERTAHGIRFRIY